LPIIFEDEQIRITHLPGDSGTAVVAFGGINGRLSRVDVGEFHQSLSGLRHDIFFVIEKIPRWYNGTFRRIAVTMENALSSGRFSRTVTLGNSMGGFGALAFAGVLPACDRAIAFSAQTSVHPVVVPFEDRWPDLRGAITEWEVPDSIPLISSSVEYVVFVGADDPTDVRQAARLTNATARTSIIHVEGCGHNAAAFIKKRGLIVPVLDELIGRGIVEKVRMLLSTDGQSIAGMAT
jgi:hypothetical protein